MSPAVGFFPLSLAHKIHGGSQALKQLLYVMLREPGRSGIATIFPSHKNPKITCNFVYVLNGNESSKVVLIFKMKYGVRLIGKWGSWTVENRTVHIDKNGKYKHEIAGMVDQATMNIRKARTQRWFAKELNKTPGYLNAITTSHIWECVFHRYSCPIVASFEE